MVAVTMGVPMSEHNRLKGDTAEPSEGEKFDVVVRKMMSVSHDEIVKREKEWKRKRQRAKQKRAKI
jgi:hypothetical protein